ncbi:hypothetical protein KIPB_002358 [Kipferlia bialata]|uniref:Uncharacterized protein n=1 Tax=Kipferlia bialata TaxID=797122 RepID=A0A9K3GG62_9EUKA|nr:hypothetical protein KIPB_002358 [Kipferlia bialata]|eukprot:g2358.t1
MDMGYSDRGTPVARRPRRSTSVTPSRWLSLLWRPVWAQSERGMATHESRRTTSSANAAAALETIKDGQISIASRIMSILDRVGECEQALCDRLAQVEGLVDSRWQQTLQTRDAMAEEQRVAAMDREARRPRVDRSCEALPPSHFPPVSVETSVQTGIEGDGEGGFTDASTGTEAEVEAMPVITVDACMCTDPMPLPIVPVVSVHGPAPSPEVQAVPTQVTPTEDEGERERDRERERERPAAKAQQRETTAVSATVSRPKGGKRGRERERPARESSAKAYPVESEQSASTSTSSNLLEPFSPVSPSPFSLPAPVQPPVKRTVRSARSVRSVRRSRTRPTRTFALDPLLTPTPPGADESLAAKGGSLSLFGGKERERESLSVSDMARVSAMHQRRAAASVQGVPSILEESDDQMLDLLCSPDRRYGS